MLPSSFDRKDSGELTIEQIVHGPLNIAGVFSKLMIKIIFIALFAIALILFAMRFFPVLCFQIQRLLQTPFVRAILFRGLCCLNSYCYFGDNQSDAQAVYCAVGRD